MGDRFPHPLIIHPNPPQIYVLVVFHRIERATSIQ